MYVAVWGEHHSRTGITPRVFYYYYYGRIPVGTRYYMLVRESEDFGIVNMHTSTWSWIGGFEDLFRREGFRQEDIERQIEIVY